jgi:RHH-type transcriptional regulator, rel operon repressor / antitoxin RelB
MSTAISVRLPDDLARQLEVIAGETDRSKSYIVQEAVKAYLQDRADLQVALDRLHDAGDAKISAKQMRRRLGL